MIHVIGKGQENDDMKSALDIRSLVVGIRPFRMRLCLAQARGHFRTGGAP
jgi:hypothetical protein